VPVVLRQLGDGLFELIGECFVYNFMEGQAVEEFRRGGSRYEERDFEIR
jgi:hypothetical protein